MPRIYCAKNAICHGAGSDPWKWVSHLPRRGTPEHDTMLGCDMVVAPSNTANGGRWKLVTFRIKAGGRGRPTHRLAPEWLRDMELRPGVNLVEELFELVRINDRDNTEEVLTGYPDTHENVCRLQGKSMDVSHWPHLRTIVRPVVGDTHVLEEGALHV